MNMSEGVRHLDAEHFPLCRCLKGERLPALFSGSDEAEQALRRGRPGGGRLSEPETVTPDAESVGAGNGASPVVSTGDGAEGPWTLQEAVGRTFQVLWTGTPSERTNMFNTRAALRFFGATCPVTTITPARIAEYTAHCQGIGNAHNTVNKKLMCLSRVMRTAFERGKLTVMPEIRLGKAPHYHLRLAEKTPQKQGRDLL